MQPHFLKTILPESLIDVPIPLLVHDYVLAGTLQQLLLRLPLAGYRHGGQNSAHHPVLGHAQRQTGESSKDVENCRHLVSDETTGSFLSHLCQLMMTVGLLAVVVYLYTVVAFNFFRKFYNKSEDEDEPDMKCDDMMTVSHDARDG